MVIEEKIIELPDGELMLSNFKNLVDFFRETDQIQIEIVFPSADHGNLSGFDQYPVPTIQFLKQRMNFGSLVSTFRHEDLIYGFPRQVDRKQHSVLVQVRASG